MAGCILALMQPAYKSLFELFFKNKDGYQYTGLKKY